MLNRSNIVTANSLFSYSTFVFAVNSCHFQHDRALYYGTRYCTRQIMFLQIHVVYESQYAVELTVWDKCASLNRPARYHTS